MPIFIAKVKTVWSFTFVYFWDLECEESHFHLLKTLGIRGVKTLPHRRVNKNLSIRTTNNYYFFFFCCGAATQRGSWPPHS